MNDASTEFLGAWERFQALDSLLLAGDTLEAEWTRGRAQYLTFLVRIADPVSVEYLSHLTERIARIPGVETYPEEYWHITVKGAGFQVIKRTHDDEILREDVPRLAGKARALLSKEAAFEAQLGPANSFEEVVFVEVRDGGRVRELNTELMESLPELERNPFDGARFLPHVSIARFTSNEGLALLKERLASMRAEGPGPSFQVRRVEFIKAWLSEEVPEFYSIATYALRPEG